MNRLLAKVLGVVIALAIGFAAGWHAKGVSVAAGQTTTARAETQTVIAGVNKQATEQNARQVVEQGKSVAMDTEQARYCAGSRGSLREYPPRRDD